MSKAAAIILEIMSSPLTASAKIAATAVVILIIDQGGNRAMDYSQIVMPEDCWMTVAAILVPFVIVFGIYTAMRSYTEMLNRKGWAASEHPYTLNYALGTVLGMILGGGLSFIAAGFITAWFGITGMPAIAYAFLAVLCALVLVWVFVTVVHLGIETTLKMIKQFANTVTSEAPGVIDAVEEAADAVKDAVGKDATETTTVVNTKTKLP